MKKLAWSLVAGSLLAVAGCRGPGPSVEGTAQAQTTPGDKNEDTGSPMAAKGDAGTKGASKDAGTKMK
jgi:hypothetical protein